MVRRGWLSGLVGALVVGTLGCGMIDLSGVRGSGTVVEESREVSGFTELELRTIGEVTVVVGETESLRIEAEDNLLPYIRTAVHTGKLVIDTEPNTWLNPTRPIRYELTVRSLEGVAVSGSGSVQVAALKSPDFYAHIAGSGGIALDGMDAERVDIQIAGSGDVTLAALEAEALEVSIPGSGNVTVEEGNVTHQGISIMGSGQYRGRALKSETAEVRISGSGDAAVRVQERLTATISGSGSVVYAGRPEVETHVSGSGHVRQTGD